MAVTEIYSFRLVLGKKKTGKGIPDSSRLEFLETFLADNFALLDAEYNFSGSLNREGIADPPRVLKTLLATLQKSWETSVWQVMDSVVLLAYASLAASRTFLQWLLVNFFFKFRRFALSVQKKKWFLWTMAAVQVAENHGDEWGLILNLIFSVKDYIHQFQLKSTQNLLAAAEALNY